ncbi:hypothetical protein OHB12_31285 [Nocardia sp. NBC_01730]|uniref:hypothetical protein n=1 Tax=Nocardia sp. NBC_01730 TaxID=2975998 RepID=UPI002E111232|nr:hypothetical protein OHB12_31285 [Nocardia sp. NBC_01730]
MTIRRRRTRAMLGAMVPMVVAVSACGAVNADAGKPATERFAMLERGTAPEGTPITAATGSGVFAEELSGSVAYLDVTTDVAGPGVVTIGPGAIPGETVLSHFGPQEQFPYEVMTVSATSTGRYVTGLAVTNPLDTRITLQCTILGGLRLDPTAGQQPVTGHCSGGTTLTGTSTVTGSRDGQWNGKTVQLHTIRTDIAFDGPVSGTLRQTADTVDGIGIAARTELETTLEAGGVRFQQNIVRTVGQNQGAR